MVLKRVPSNETLIKHAKLVAKNQNASVHLGAATVLRAVDSAEIIFMQPNRDKVSIQFVNGKMHTTI